MPVKDGELKAVEIKTKRNAANSRARLLAAAKRCFSEHGYAATGIRDVADAAGVSYTLLSRYFGSKAGLLEAALTDSLAAEPFLVADRSQFGLNLAKLIVVAKGGQLPTAISVLAAADPEARKIATRVVEAKVIEPLAAWLGPPDERRRAVEITMLGAGFVTHAHLIPLMDNAEGLGSSDPLVQWLADSFQRIVDEYPAVDSSQR
jgi:AcrR family transcriptional regulator